MIEKFSTLFRIQRIAPMTFDVFDRGTGECIGRYGGRAHAKWSQLADGTMVVDNSPLSVSSVRSLLVRAWRERRPA